ncbi:uncharacterized protein L969DRAFT_280679 [Mixia osmundae IAM 14324]|uniref:uncharacterized protein n=1 Tax=Mixia osmundae (strain CBS 9802 / IAM 14324 / JCM 22182 / KY 12970) TaxID=764103 RepID=UPI0004A553FB|nr:uncharacterized protein L969DRAFT_280679 [Mixia osmundae IAM 14324]KEI36305.1 hypothetical protein L969DRAFT_280679 [Mixia osmundae IAM 14324]
MVRQTAVGFGAFGCSTRWRGSERQHRGGSGPKLGDCKPKPYAPRRIGSHGITCGRPIHSSFSLRRQRGNKRHPNCYKLFRLRLVSSTASPPRLRRLRLLSTTPAGLSLTIATTIPSQSEGSVIWPLIHLLPGIRLQRPRNRSRSPRLTPER